MPDLTFELGSHLKDHRIEGLQSDNDFIYPNYSGQSILNVPSTLCALLGAPPFGAPPLRQGIIAPLGGPYQKVILLLVDALALQRFRDWMLEPEFGIWRQLAEHGFLAPLTSVSPSTTCAALTSLWTGVPPARHGVVGYELWLKEYGLVANMILHSPFSFEKQAGVLRAAGFVAEDFLQLPTLGQHLAANDIQAYAFQGHSLIGSGLSNMFFPRVSRVGYYMFDDLWITLQQALADHANERAFYWLYWPDIDTFSHKFGPDDERVHTEFAAFTQAFQRLFYDKLDAAARKNILFLLAADHGMVATQTDPHYDLRNHPGLTRRLHMMPTGENRLAYLFVRPGQIEAVREYIERAWPRQFIVWESDYVQECGLFGSGEHSPRLAERLGDLVVAARGNAYWWWGTRENPLIGRHGGLTADEMLVPFLASPLAL